MIASMTGSRALVVGFWLQVADAVMASLMTIVHWVMSARDHTRPTFLCLLQVSLSGVWWVWRLVYAVMLLEGTLAAEMFCAGM